MTTAPLHMSLKSWALLLVLSIIWAGSFIANEVMLTHYGYRTIVAFRVLGGALALLPLLFILNKPLPRGLKIWGILMLIALFNNVTPFLLIVWGQQYIEAGLASILNAVTPILTVVLAHFVTHDEKISRRKVVGIGFGFFGVVVLFNPDAISLSGMALWGQLALLGSSLAYAVGVISLRKLFAMGVGSLQGAFGQLACSAVIMIPLALWTENFIQLPAPTLEVMMAIGFVTLFSSALAYILYFKLANEAGATNASLVTVIIPPFALLMGVLLLGETIGITEVIGILLISFGLLVTNGIIGKKRPAT